VKRQATPYAVEVEGLTKRFKRPRQWRNMLRKPPIKIALAGIDLQVRRGEIFGLLGPNGAGKTTLIKILCGLVLPDKGRALVNGIDVGRNSLEVRHAVGVVYGDERSFFMRLSVRENLRFYSRLYRMPPRVADRRISELLSLVDLADAADLRMHYLSSGMKQRAAIARGLIHDPDVLFMDEPTRSLDPLGAEDLHILIRERVAAGGRTVLLATHLMNEAEALCNRITLIDRGRTVHTGTVEDFRGLIRQEVVYRLVFTGGRPGWERGLHALPGVVKATVIDGEDRSHSIELILDRRTTALPTAIRYLVEQSGDILSCTREDLTLEEIFRAVVRQRRAVLVEATR
jgi:ABC-2 type transport system ATP-binding protein